MSQFRTITIARQYGSGGSPIAEKIAAHLGWDLLDNALITRVATAAQVDRKVCQKFDEAVDSWMHRLTKRAFGRGAFEGVAVAEVFDCDAMERFAKQMIEEAARSGNVVIVGRGGQCILQGRSDVFHAFVYAPLDQRMRRISQKFGPSHATPELIRESDRERAAYVRHHYHCEWCSPHLYDAMFSSTLGEETVAKAILTATRLLPS